MVGWLRCLLMDNYQTSILKVSGLLNCLKQRVLLLETVLDKGYGLFCAPSFSLFPLHSALPLCPVNRPVNASCKMAALRASWVSSTCWSLSRAASSLANRLSMRDTIRCCSGRGGRGNKKLSISLFLMEGELSPFMYLFNPCTTKGLHISQ